MCAEAEGIFLWCLEGLQRLIENNYHFTVSERARENMAEAVSDGNNAVDFMRSEGYIRLKADAEASSREIYAGYSSGARTTRCTRSRPGASRPSSTRTAASTTSNRPTTCTCPEAAAYAATSASRFYSG